MIKRPMVWVLLAYLAGLYLAWHSISLLWTAMIAFFLYLILYLLIFQMRNDYINELDRFVWLLPILLLFGFFAMGGQLIQPELEMTFEKEADCSLSGEITMIVEKQWGRALYVKNNMVYNIREKPYLCENIIVYCSDEQNYLVGNKITVYGTIQKFSKSTNPGQFNEKMYYQIANIDYKFMADEIQITDDKYSKLHVLLNRIKEKLIGVYHAILPQKEAGTMIAMLLGEKYLLDEEIKQLYQENGISHILAISGLHITLIGLSIYKILKKIKVGLIPATFLSILFIYGYGVLTNFSVSTNRAVVMLVVMLLSKLFGKTYDMLSATSLSAFLILLQNPLQLFHAGFLLSFGAILGIAFFLPCLQLLFPIKNSMINGLFVCISAQAMTIPLVLFFYYQLPVYSLFINIFIIPCMSILVLTALVAGVVGVIYLPIGVFFIGGTNYILKFYEWLCRFGSELPGNLITVGRPDWLRLLLYLILMLLFVLGVKKYNKKSFIIILFIAVLILVLPRTKHGLEITMLDVGQGDGIFMETTTGTTYLIDGGSTDVKQVGRYRLQPFLLSKGVSKINYAILTHSDTDHMSGLMELMEGDKISIEHLILPKIINEDTAYKGLKDFAIENGIQVLYMEAGDVILEGDIQMMCLHPTPKYLYTSANDYSTVLSITYGEFDMLLTGDLEQKGEIVLTELFQSIQSGTEYSFGFGVEHSITFRKQNADFVLPAVDYDVLKVAHHGSKNSTFENFLQLVQPEYALISCGKDNMYGHPHVELLSRLEQIGSDVKITYESGAITIKTDGEKMEIREYRRD